MTEKEEKLGGALMKVALGYQIAEVTEEYADVNGELKLTRRKKTKKDVPPDLKAVQLLLAVEEGNGYSALSDEELEEEKRRLLSALQKETSIPKSKPKEGGKVATKAKKTTATKKKTVKKK